MPEVMEKFLFNLFALGVVEEVTIDDRPDFDDTRFLAQISGELIETISGVGPTRTDALTKALEEVKTILISKNEEYRAIVDTMTLLGIDK